VDLGNPRHQQHNMTVGHHLSVVIIGSLMFLPPDFASLKIRKKGTGHEKENKRNISMVSPNLFTYSQLSPPFSVLEKMEYLNFQESN
jgi:hypothetical protein